MLRIRRRATSSSTAPSVPTSFQPTRTSTALDSTSSNYRRAATTSSDPRPPSTARAAFVTTIVISDVSSPSADTATATTTRATGTSVGTPTSQTNSNIESSTVISSSLSDLGLATSTPALPSSAFSLPDGLPSPSDAVSVPSSTPDASVDNVAAISAPGDRMSVAFFVTAGFVSAGLIVLFALLFLVPCFWRKVRAVLCCCAHRRNDAAGLIEQLSGSNESIDHVDDYNSETIAYDEKAGMRASQSRHSRIRTSTWTIKDAERHLRQLDGVDELSYAQKPYEWTPPLPPLPSTTTKPRTTSLSGASRACPPSDSLTDFAGIGAYGLPRIALRGTHHDSFWRGSAAPTPAGAYGMPNDEATEHLGTMEKLPSQASSLYSQQTVVPPTVVVHP